MANAPGSRAFIRVTRGRGSPKELDVGRPAADEILHSAVEDEPFRQPQTSRERIDMSRNRYERESLTRVLPRPRAGLRGLRTGAAWLLAMAGVFATLSPVSLAFADAAPVANAANAYVVFVDGINSCQGPWKGCNAEAGGSRLDFSGVEEYLGQQSGRKTHFVYFSYGALPAEQTKGGRYCEGWELSDGKPDCGKMGNLVSLSALPLYSSQDTHLPIPQQAVALDWLLHQLPSKATIDLMGFSLGGVISSYWAATHSPKSGLGPRIHSITLVDSPVGGVPGAEWFAGQKCMKSVQKFVCTYTYNWLQNDLFGSTVLDELRPDTGAKLLELLPKAAQFPIYVIQNSLDYLVNGTGIPFCFTNKSCAQGKVDLDLLVGRGPQVWTGVSPKHMHIATDLGGDTLCYPASKSCPKPLPGPLSLVYTGKKNGPDPFVTTFVELEFTLPGNHVAALNNPASYAWFDQAVK